MALSIESAIDTGALAEEQRGLLELIDKLQFAQLDNIKLPQIVVVGDQSAGKSSVLEAITGTPFPRDAGACTRFATEIRLRRSAASSLAVSIIPDKNRPFKEQEKLRQFGGSVDANTPFDTLMRLAVELIAPRNIPGRFAARDILVVEKRGPDMPLLTLVDLPGLVRNANNDQSTEDIRTIEALSDRYMKSSRTIILAVVGGNSDYVQAPILTKARQFDPSGSRTIGVLTKPDLTESIGLEDKFIELVQNRDRRNLFRLGWYVLLNPGPREPGQSWPTSQERQEREVDFFSRGRWSTLPESMCGANALKQKLSVQLQRHIGRHVKTLRRQIQKALDDCDAELKSLGTGKDTVEEMRIELVELFSASKELVIPAVYGFYKNPPRKNFFRVSADPRGTPAQNLRARTIEENDRFAERIRAQGRKFAFTSDSDPRSPSGVDDAASMSDGGKRDFARQEVEMLLRQIRGSEFPMDPKPRAVYMLFQSYSENWPRLAQEHKDNLGVVCNEFLGELVDYAWPRRMREPLRRQFLDPQMTALMDKAQAELDLLTQDMNLEVQPYDPEYEERLQKWHAEVVAARGPGGPGSFVVEAEEVLEKMLIYYELSAKSFIRNVITQVVERHLLQGMYGVFNSVEVLSMSNAAVEAVAAENRETRDRRLALKAQRRAIEEAKATCAGLAMRKELRAYAVEDEQADADSSSGDDGDSVATVRERQASATAQQQQQQQAASGSASSSSRHREQQQRRSSRQAREDAYSTDPTYSGPIQPTVPAPRPTATLTPLPEAAPKLSSEDEGYYSTSKPAPSHPPPVPPPRPEKVTANPGNADDLPSSPMSASAHRSSTQQQLSGDAAGSGYYSYGSNNPYIPATMDPRRGEPGIDASGDTYSRPAPTTPSSSSRGHALRKMVGRA